MSLVALVSGCGEFKFEGFLDQPIPIAVDQDIPLVELEFGNDERVTAPIDTGTPITAVNRAGALQIRPGTDIGLKDSARSDVTRFIFRDVDVVETEINAVGLNTPVGVGGILGADVLSFFAVHLNYSPPLLPADATGSAAGTLILRDRIADTDDQLATDCDLGRLLLPGGFADQRCIATLPTPRRGGGLTVIGDEQRTLRATRLVVPVCIGPEDFDPSSDVAQLPDTSGVPLTAVIATGLGVSVISRSAFERLVAAGYGLIEQPDQTLLLPGSEEPVSSTTIPGLAVVSDRTRDLGACGELARRRRLLIAGRNGVDPQDEAQDGASVALLSGPIPFIVVPDEAPLLQGYLQELTPTTADIEILLGGSFFKSFEIDFDYPAGRTLLQCAVDSAGNGCETIPHCVEGDTPPCSCGGDGASPCP